MLIVIDVLYDTICINLVIIRWLTFSSDHKQKIASSLLLIFSTNATWLINAFI